MNKSETHLFGILGYPLTHTLSPVMQEAAMKSMKLPGFYLAYEITRKNYGSFWSSLAKSPMQGLNVTVPFKENVFRSVQIKSPEAKAIGAVNTLYKKGNRWAGTNTDAYGFARSLELDANFTIKGKRALIFGAGGSARAVLYALLKECASEVLICNRTRSKAESLKRHFKKIFPKQSVAVVSFRAGQIKDLIEAADLIVNTTSLGLKKSDASVISLRDISQATPKNKKLFFDLIYKPAETKFLKLAKSKGHRVLNGLGMLAYQGAKSLEVWTGKKSPETLMKQTLKKALL